MSYCRFSSADWKSEVYCYADVHGGYTTHVASRKPKVELPSTEGIPLSELDTFLKVHKEQMELLENTEYEPIGLPYDGKTFNDPDLLSFRERLEMLKETGYMVPEYVFKLLDEEIDNGAI